MKLMNLELQEVFFRKFLMSKISGLQLLLVQNVNIPKFINCQVIKLAMYSISLQDKLLIIRRKHSLYIYKITHKFSEVCGLFL
jgi:hypothetical protein